MIPNLAFYKANKNVLHTPPVKTRAEQAFMRTMDDAIRSDTKNEKEVKRVEKNF